MSAACAFARSVPTRISREVLSHHRGSHGARGAKQRFSRRWNQRLEGRAWTTASEKGVLCVPDRSWPVGDQPSPADESIEPLHLGLLGDLQRIVNLDSEVAHRTLLLGVAERAITSPCIRELGGVSLYRFMAAPSAPSLQHHLHPVGALTADSQRLPN
jgi:hypothetical protein